MRAKATLLISFICVMFVKSLGFCQTPELVVNKGHSAEVKSVAFSPDGRYVVTGSYDQTAKLWEAATGKELQTFGGHSHKVTSVAFSPDGRYVVTGSYDQTAKLWETATGKELRTFRGHSSFVWSVALSPDGRYVVTGSFDRTAKLWDAATGKELRTFGGHSSWVYSVAFSPDGRYVVTGSGYRTAKLWEIATGKELRIFKGHSDDVRSVAFSPDGHYVVTGSDDKTAKLWETATGKELRTFGGHSSWVWSVAFSPDGRYVVTGSLDKTAKLWDAATGKELRTFSGHSDSVWSVAFSPDGRYVVTGSSDETAKLWEAATGKELRTFGGHSSGVQSVAFSPDGRYVVTGSGDKTAKLWDAATGKELRTFGGHSSGVQSVAFSPDGRYVVTGSLDKTAKLWDAATGKELRTFSGHSDSVWSVAFSPDGRYVVTGSLDNTAKLWDAATGKELRTFSGHSSFVSSVAFSPDGRYVVTGSWDQTAKLWEIATGKELRTFEGHSERVESVAFSPDGRYVVTGSLDKTAKLWDAATGKELRTLGTHSWSVWSVAFSPDGRYVVTGSWDKTAKLWEAATGKELRTFSGHLSEVYSVAFSPDGRYVVTGSLDATTKIWDPTSGALLCTLISLDKEDWVVVTPDGRFDGSPEAMRLMHYVVGFETIELGQLKERYYEPGVLAKVMGFNKEPLRDVTAFNVVKLFPHVEAQLSSNATALKIKLMDRGGGIGKVRVLVNGKEIVADARGPKPDLRAQQSELNVNLAGAPFIPGKENLIQVLAWNAEGYLSSRGEVISVTPPATDDPSRRPDLYAIVAGISNYAAPQMNLTFAAKDAEDMATALELGGKNLFGTAKTHIHLLTTTGRKGVVQPSKENLRQAFEQVAKNAKPWDVFVVYLAGHGVALSGTMDVYLYPTVEARTLDSQALADTSLRQVTTVSSDELIDWIKQVKALKQVMILDTCAAGAVTLKLVEKRDISSDQIRAIERLKDRTGFHVLMGSAANAVSYEASRYGQGLLTYSLLQGMKGAALKEDQYVDVSKLFEYAADEVPRLAQNIGGIQRPIVARPTRDSSLEASFDIGLLQKSDKEAIPLARVQPLILRPVLMNLEQGYDNLELMSAFRKRLQEESWVAARDRNESQLGVYVDAEEMPGAVRPFGTYVVAGQNLTVTLNLIRDGQKVSSFQVKGNQTDLGALIDEIVQKLGQTLPKF